MTPHLGDVQIARALILSHAGKKPLARYRVTLTVCDTGAVSTDLGGGPVSAAIRVALPPRDRMQKCRCALTFYGWRIALRGKSGRFRVFEVPERRGQS